MNDSSLWGKLRFILGASFIVVCQPLAAQIVTWDGSSSGNWSDATNWDSAPALPTSTDVATFDASAASGQYAITLGADRTVLGVDFTLGGSNGFTVNSGNAVTVGTSGIVKNNTLIAPITETADATITSDSGTLFLCYDTALVPFAEPISLGASSLTFNTDGGNITVGSTLSGTGASPRPAPAPCYWSMAATPSPAPL
jgi:hypothetical protein